MSKKILFLSLVSFSFGAHAFAISPPGPPSDPNHPGSLSYHCSFTTEHFNAHGIDADLYLPRQQRLKISNSFPVVVFGHGHAVGLWGYRTTFEHLAKKCIAVIFPTYDPKVYNSDFVEMGHNYLNVAVAALKSHSTLNSNAVIFSGHSNGSLVALIAAGLDETHLTKGLLLFSLPGYNKELLNKVPSSIPVTFVSGDQDAENVISSSKLAYQNLLSGRKQHITIKSYTQTTPKVIANHGMTRTSNVVSNYVNSIHYYAVWKYLVSSAYYAQNKSYGDYIYGKQATSTGLANFFDDIERNYTTLR